MSDDQQNPTDEHTTETGEWTPPASPEEFNRIIQNRLERERAKYADVDELREKARYWDEIEQASKSEYERQQEELTRWQNEATTWRSQAVSSQVETLAAEKFADPSDALSAIDPSAYLGAGGEIDKARITADLDALLERKPHWRKQADTGPAAPRVPAPNPSQGSGGNGRSAADPAVEFGALVQGLLK